MLGVLLRAMETEISAAQWARVAWEGLYLLVLYWTDAMLVLGGFQNVLIDVHRNCLPKINCTCCPLNVDAIATLVCKISGDPQTEWNWLDWTIYRQNLDALLYYIVGHASDSPLVCIANA